MKKAIHQIAAEILAEHKRAMSADEIYSVITSRGLYEFKAKSPKTVLRSQLRRHSQTGQGDKSTSKPLFSVTADGLFSLA